MAPTPDAMADDMGPTHGAINELLSYALFHYKSSTKQALFDILLNWYTPGEIDKAKRQLYDLHSDFLGSRPSRKSTPNRAVHEADLWDILDAVCKYDVADSSVAMPVFGAVNLSRLPPSAPMPATAEGCNDRVTSMEAEFQGLQVTLSQHDQLLHTLCDSVSEMKAALENRFQGPAEPERPQPAPYRDALLRNQRSNSVSSHSSAFHRKNMSTIGSTSGIGRRHFPPAPPHKVPFRKSSTSAYPPRDRGISRSDQNNHKRFVIGANKTSGTVKGGAPTRQAFVYHVEKSVSEDDMFNFLKNQVNVLELKQINHPDARFHSFKLIVPLDDYDALYDSMFWPEDVRCKNYVNRWRNSPNES
jgi:hypothetical protein